jgi:hypothetical protein
LNIDRDCERGFSAMSCTILATEYNRNLGVDCDCKERRFSAVNRTILATGAITGSLWITTVRGHLPAQEKEGYF